MKKRMVFSAMVLAVFVLSSVAMTTSATPAAVRKVKVDTSSTETVVPTVTTSSVGDGIVNKYALIIGISDYKAISDLSFCDEDATDWYNYLSGEGYQITLLGDDTSSYPKLMLMMFSCTLQADTVLKSGLAREGIEPTSK